MTTIFKQFADFLTPAPRPTTAPAPSVAQALMEQAEAFAGRNSIDAENLRSAARAYLSVIR